MVSVPMGHEQRDGAESLHTNVSRHKISNEATEAFSAQQQVSVAVKATWQNAGRAETYRESLAAHRDTILASILKTPFLIWIVN